MSIKLAGAILSYKGASCWLTCRIDVAWPSLARRSTDGSKSRPVQNIIGASLIPSFAFWLLISQILHFTKSNAKDGWSMMPRFGIEREHAGANKAQLAGLAAQ